MSFHVSLPLLVHSVEVPFVLSNLPIHILTIFVVVRQGSVDLSQGQEVVPLEHLLGAIASPVHVDDVDDSEAVTIDGRITAAHVRDLGDVRVDVVLGLD